MAPNRITIQQQADLDLAPGTRVGNWFQDTIECCVDANDSQVNCNDPRVADREIHQIKGEVLQPASAGSALLSSPVELDADSIGVVTGQANDDGTHTLIFKKLGSPARQVDIDSDVELLPGDVLRDLIDLGQDPNTREHLYLADIEW